MNVERLTEFTIYLAQRPGELAGLLEAAAVAGVDIEGLAVTEYNERGLVRLIGAPEESLRHVMESLVESGLGPAVETPVLGVEIDQRPGAVRDLSVMMADARVNVKHVYLCPAQNGNPTRVIVCVDDLDKAIETISAHVS
jgi:hypothetical protein